MTNAVRMRRSAPIKIIGHEKKEPGSNHHHFGNSTENTARRRRRGHRISIQILHSAI